MLQRPARSCARHPDSSPAMASSLAGQIVTFYAVDMPAFTGRLRSAQEWPRAGRASACCSRTSPSSFSPPSRALSKAPSERWQGRTDGCDAAFVGRALRVANFLATRKPVHDRDSGTNFFRAVNGGKLQRSRSPPQQWTSLWKSMRASLQSVWWRPSRRDARQSGNGALRS